MQPLFSPWTESLTTWELAQQANLAAQEAQGSTWILPRSGIPNGCHQGTRNQTHPRQAGKWGEGSWIGNKDLGLLPYSLI